MFWLCMLLLVSIKAFLESIAKLLEFEKSAIGSNWIVVVGSTVVLHNCVSYVFE